MTSFENTKSSITGSALGKYLSMTSSTSWNDIVNKIKGVTFGSRSVKQTSNTNSWDATTGGYTFLTYVTVDATSVYNTGYNAGVTAADNRANSNSTNYKTGYNNGYSAGRTQGQNDVKNNPNGYGFYTKSQYDSNWSDGYNSGWANRANISSGHCTTGNYVNVGFQPNIVLIKRDGDKLPAGLYSSTGVNINYMEGPSQSHQENIIYTNGSGFGFNNLSSYNNNKWCYYVAARIG